MTLKGKVLRLLYPILLRVVYFLHLRIPWSLLCRWVQHETARKPVADYPAPGEIEYYMQRDFKYRKDPLNGKVDYTSHPEYVQATLDDPSSPDGDCDDGHWYVANALKKTPDVTEVYFLSSGYDGPKGRGGHCTAVYKYLGRWYHYDWGIYPIDHPQQAVEEVATRYGGEGAKPTFWVWEGVGEVGKDRSGWKPVAICPKTLKV